MKVEYKRMSLRPYPGEILLFRDLTHMRAYYEQKTKEKYDYKDEVTGGRFILLEHPKQHDGDVWLVYARKPHVLAHELGHILFRVFKMIGSDPYEGNQEPFLYMLSQLMLEAA